MREYPLQYASTDKNKKSHYTIADADIGSLKSLHTLFDKHLDQMLVEFEQNFMVRTSNYTNILAFWQKMVYHFW